MPITNIGHPWGGERESAKMTGLRLPPPCRGLRDRFSSVSWRTGSLDDALRAFGARTKTATVVLAFGRCPTSAVPNHQGNVSSPTRSRRRPTSSLFTRGHRDDQCGISSCLGIVWPEPARDLPNSTRPRQGFAGAPGTGQSAAGAPGSGQDPAGSSGAQQDCSGSSGSEQDHAGSSGSEQDHAGSSGSEQDHAGSSGSEQDHAGSSRSEQDHAGSSGAQQNCSDSVRSEQDFAGSSGSGQSAAGAPGSGQGAAGAPGSGQGLAGAPGSEQGFGPILITLAKWRKEFVGSVSRVPDTLASHQTDPMAACLFAETCRHRRFETDTWKSAASVISGPLATPA
jgi:hypothetical protein